jgi:hypothetical protein
MLPSCTQEREVGRGWTGGLYTLPAASAGLYRLADMSDVRPAHTTAACDGRATAATWSKCVMRAVVAEPHVHMSRVVSHLIAGRKGT